MAEWLREVGRIRPGREMEPEILYEVFRAAAAGLRCRQCGETGMAVTTAADERVEWPGAGTCAKCGRPIGRERLEAVPGATCCAACQNDQERGRSRADRDHCPRCGAPMEVRAVPHGRGTRYVLACSANPPCPL